MSERKRRVSRKKAAVHVRGSSGVPPDQLKLTWIVNGQPYEMRANASAPLHHFVDVVLHATHNLGRPVDHWEVRDITGKLFDVSQPIGALVSDDATLYLNPSAGIGGATSPASPLGERAPQEVQGVPPCMCPCCQMRRAAGASGERPAALEAAKIEAGETIRREASNLAHDAGVGERPCCADLAQRIGRGIRWLPVEKFVADPLIPTAREDG